MAKEKGGRLRASELGGTLRASGDGRAEVPGNLPSACQSTLNVARSWSNLTGLSQLAFQHALRRLRDVPPMIKCHRQLGVPTRPDGYPQAFRKEVLMTKSL